MRIFKTRAFARLATKAGLKDETLARSIQRLQDGRAEARLGKHLVKLRIAREGEGRSGGYRAIVVEVEGGFALLVHMFAKSDAANLTAPEQETYRDLAKLIARLDNSKIANLLSIGEWVEVEDGQNDDSA